MIEDVLYYVAAGGGAAFQLTSACHALLNKRDPRSQLGWVVLCVMVPIVGALAYWLFGVNRIRTRARRWQERGRFRDLSGDGVSDERAIASLADQHPEKAEELRQLLQIAERVTRRPLMGGNLVEPLYNGEQAYPAMLEAIEQARSYVYLSTYIFNVDSVGARFVEALGRAASRGVDVRVLVDAIGEKYGRPRLSKALREHPEVRLALFLPLTLSWKSVRVNMRNHRKLLVADGRVGFTGGMNIAERHLVATPTSSTPTRDIQFRVRGPVVPAMVETFMEDWYFVTGDAAWPAQEIIEPAGDALCRPIKDGPNEDFERLQWILVGAMSCARESIRIITPYFIPGRELLAALNSAVLRGVHVELILPEASNLPYVDWACRAMLWEVLQYGTTIYLQPPPFDHTKLLIVDDFYVNLGSANLDPRSLRLNFELNLEVFDPDLGTELARHFVEVRARSRPITINSLDRRPFPVKLRDAAAKLFAPYL
ncbi:MAG TPA: phospholipase D-like domain-containing protein [Kofleriaceae bacterium]|nr:phospholipase D-like domain-containing protein [Kofleriaceae bacterium]